MGLNNTATRAKSTAQDVFSFGQRQVDRAVPPETRQKAYDGVGVFAQERPILFVRPCNCNRSDEIALDSQTELAYLSAKLTNRRLSQSLIATQLFFATLPILCFATFTVSAAGAALAGALLFALFWTGVALFVFLVPALLVASAAAALVWLWAISAFLVARWVYLRTQTAQQETTITPTPTASKLAAVQNGQGAAAGGGGGVDTDGDNIPFSTNPDPGLTDVRYGSSNGGDNDNGDGDVKKEKADDGGEAAAQTGE
ncbi:hypothetical protein SLS62_011003 [Diatrype stigma]|uniref:Uncharacterized protein n=1 Tax=Diatrype stigma TaxID=117547 RepID=A0AAN9YEU9_9PEZI